MAFSVDSSKTGAAEDPEEREKADKIELSGKAEAMSEASSPVEEKTEPLRDKAVYKYNLPHEIMKGLIGIALLISILTTLAMFADLYFNNSFLYFKRSFWGHTYLTENESQHSVANGKSKKSELPIFELFDDQPDPKPTEIPLLVTDHEKNAMEEDRDDNEVGYSQKKLIDGNKGSDSDKKKLNRGKQPASYSIPKVRLSLPLPAKAEKKKRFPLIAIIIDDVGFDPKIADAISGIESNFTISILPGSPYGKKIAQSLHSRGVQIMLHLPMEPLQYPAVDPGDGAILSNMAPGQVVKMLNINLNAIPYIEGVNNHMGSRLTALSPQMIQILRVLKEKQLFFIDSLTSNCSKGRESAKVIELLFASRDIFLDNVKERGNIKKQLRELIRVARRNGKAIAIGHPYNETYTVLKEEIATLKKNAKVVPASQLVEVP